ncbi:hypothetical protein MNBD_GAMMA06-1823 [hydrothermal vent metagenome]|uniref:Uncharacterized protein n=1 Tax=hydrothermal vent metagenome TaxID=652676 RepID=A0A3B0W750_9ZZZZ
MKKITAILFLLSSLITMEVNAVTQDEMEKVISDTTNIIENKKGYIVFDYKKVRMALISNVEYDRMRIITPIKKYSELDLTQIEKIMDSNFHSALDARYASSKDVLYSAFIHPMSPLSKKELISALNQVATLALTFGTTYSSGALNYGGN